MLLQSSLPNSKNAEKENKVDGKFIEEVMTG
jgi:hypothetical protein